jgi:hypothetical protein
MLNNEQRRERDLIEDFCCYSQTYSYAEILKALAFKYYTTEEEVERTINSSDERFKSQPLTKSQKIARTVQELVGENIYRVEAVCKIVAASFGLTSGHCYQTWRKDCINKAKANAGSQ